MSRVKDVTHFIKGAQNVTFIIGAGASMSAGIPLAGGLIKQIKEQFGHCLSGLTEEEKKNYGKVMGALSPGDRKSLIQPLLEKSTLNWGHIALACLLGSPDLNIQRVLSFNFDLVLERALALIGLQVPVYDFGVVTTAEPTNLAQPAIVHLHGQSYGLRLLNSDEETKKHSEALRPIFADSLRNHVVIVIGYSGEADAAFDVIAKEYSNTHYLFWLGHEKEPKSHLKPLMEER